MTALKKITTAFLLVMPLMTLSLAAVIIHDKPFVKLTTVQEALLVGAIVCSTGSGLLGILRLLQQRNNGAFAKIYGQSGLLPRTVRHDLNSNTSSAHRTTQQSGMNIHKDADTDFYTHSLIPHEMMLAVASAAGSDNTEQAKLREQVNYLAGLVDQCNDAIVSVNPNGEIVSWNAGASAIYGYTLEEVVGKNVSLLVPPELGNEEMIIIGKALNGQRVHQFETERIKKDGSRVTISLTLSCVKDASGNVTGVVGMTRDISEKKEIAKKIIQSEENLQAIFDNTSEGFILTDIDLIIKSLNRKIQQISMFNQLVSIEPGQMLLNFIPEERRDLTKTLLDKALLGETIQFDQCYTLADGTIAWYHTIYSPVKKDETIRGLCITIRNITERKIAEQQREFDRNNLNALINNTRDLMWSVDRNFNLITSNIAFDEMISRMSGKAIEKNKSVLQWHFDSQMQDRYKHFYERAFAGEAFMEVEYTVSSFEYWAENSFYPIYEGNKVVGTACYSRDISKQKKAEEQLQNSFNEKWALAERMSAILNTLPANVALLNEQGIIVDVNNSWKDADPANGFQGRELGIGQNYLKIEDSPSACGNGEDAKRIAAGIRSVITKNIHEFVYEYTCNIPHKKRWFRVMATPITDKDYSGAVVMHVDISKIKLLEQNRLELKVREQKNITQAIMQAQEDERNELGRELHDNICQILAAIKMKLSFCADNHSLSLPIIQEAVFYMNQAVDETRNLSHRMLMPRFAESTLEDALKSLAITYTHDKRIVTLETDRTEDESIPPPVKETLYRIAQEQLHNIEKYAKASNVMMQVDAHGNVIKMSIQDNGIGFDPQKKRGGVGLTNIRNRTESFNGSTRIISAPGEGCLLMVEIPFRDKQQQR